MIIRGKEFSEDTIAEALQKHCNFEEEKKPYIFKRGDVVVNSEGYRIIVSHQGKLHSFDAYGKRCSVGQKEFDFYGYKKIGTLTNFIKENQNESAS